MGRQKVIVVSSGLIAVTVMLWVFLESGEPLRTPGEELPLAPERSQVRSLEPDVEQAGSRSEVGSPMSFQIVEETSGEVLREISWEATSNDHEKVTGRTDAEGSLDLPMRSDWILSSPAFFSISVPALQLEPLIVTGCSRIQIDTGSDPSWLANLVACRACSDAMDTKEVAYAYADQTLRIGAVPSQHTWGYGWEVSSNKEHRVATSLEQSVNIKSPQSNLWSGLTDRPNVQRLPVVPQTTLCPLSAGIELPPGGAAVVEIEQHVSDGRIVVKFDDDIKACKDSKVVLRTLQDSGATKMWHIVEGGESHPTRSDLLWTSPFLPPGEYRVDLVGVAEDPSGSATIHVRGFQGALRRSEILTMASSEMKPGSIWCTIDASSLNGSANLLCDFSMGVKHRVMVNVPVLLGGSLRIGPFGGLKGLVRLTSESGDTLFEGSGEIPANLAVQGK